MILKLFLELLKILSKNDRIFFKLENTVFRNAVLKVARQ